MRLTTDNWQTIHGDRETTVEPSWQQVEDAMRGLGEQQRAIVTLEHSAQTNLIVAGGNGSYMITIAPQEPSVPAPASDSGGNGDQPHLAVGDLDLVLRASRAYFETGHADQSIDWIAA